MALVPPIEYADATPKVRANKTNRLANGYRIDVDAQFRDPLEPLAR